MLNFSSYFLVDLCCFTLHDYVYISVVYACSSSLCYCSTVAVKGGKLDWQLIALISSYLRLYFRSHASVKPDEQMEALCAQPVQSSLHSFVLCQTCKRDILKRNKPILLKICTSGPWGKGMKCSTLAVMRSKFKVTKIPFIVKSRELSNES